MQQSDYKKRKVKLYNSAKWMRLAEKIRNKHYGLCQRCGAPNSREVHHKRPISPANIDDVNIVYNEDNLMLLCRACHNHMHNRKSKNLYEDKMHELTFDEEGNLLLIE